MKVHTLAGSRRIAEPALPPEPSYRWTFTTWVEKRWKDYDGWRKKDVDRRTVTVFASSEDVAKQKIESALPPVPVDVEPVWSSDPEERYKRCWDLEASVEEVR